jgi:predicted PurR-regulated permease PerM
MATRRASRPPSFFARALLAALAGALVLSSVALCWFGAHILLAVFAGILFAIFLRVPVDALHRHVGMRPLPAFALVLVALAGLFVLGVLLAAPSISREASALGKEIPRSIQQVERSLMRSDTGRSILESARNLTEGMEGKDLARRALGALSSVAGALGLIVLFFFVGFFVAANPALYRDGFLRLFPTARRPHARDVLDSLHQTLASWLLGRVIAMAVIGVLTGLGLWMLGMPLVIALAFIAGLLNFIPFLGPALSAIPAVLIAFAKGPDMMLYVGLLYFGIQALENHLITPLLEQRMVELPPALTLVSQVLFGLAFGLPGVILATPLTACILVLIRKTYVDRMPGGR